MKILCHINPAPLEAGGVEINLPMFPKAGDDIEFSEITQSASYVRADRIVRVRDRRDDASDYEAEVWTSTAEPPGA